MFVLVWPSLSLEVENAHIGLQQGLQPYERGITCCLSGRGVCNSMRDECPLSFVRVVIRGNLLYQIHATVDRSTADSLRRRLVKLPGED